MQPHVAVKNGYSPNCVYGVQESDWFEEVIMLDWIEKLWKSFLPMLMRRRTILILDSLRTHLTDAVKD